MKRKVVKHGTATLTISLPVQWIKKFNIRQGDELDVEERGNRIIVKPYNELAEKEIVINIEKREDFARRFIIIPYIQGYNNIKVKFGEREILPRIQEVIANYIMGFEIVEQGNNYCVLKNIAKGIEDQFDVMLNRLAIITIGMLKDIHEAFKTNKLDIIAESKSSEMAANKISLFCRRMLNILGHKDKSPTGIYSTVTYLEELTDEAHYICDYAVKNKIKADRRLVAYTQDIVRQIELWYKTFNNYKQELMVEMKKLELRLQKENLEMLENANSKEVVIVHYLAAIQENLHHMNEELS